MQFLGPTSRKRLAYGIYAVALVWSLTVYQSAVVPKPLAVAQDLWAAILATLCDRSPKHKPDHVPLQPEDITVVSVGQQQL